MKTLYTLLFLIFSTFAWCQDFTYTPKNPAFGGFTYNYQWLLSSAQVQDNTVDPNRVGIDDNERDELADFEQSLNRQILSELSREIVRTQFSTEGLSEGTYNLGTYQLDVTEGLDGLNVNILDVTTGSQTNIFIPFY